MVTGLSVVVLCYKSGKNVVPFVERLLNSIDPVIQNWEIVLVGNYNKGDTEDDTPRVVREIAARDKRIKAVTLEKKGWMGWDARTGMAEATGETIALIDGDNQMPPEDVIRVYQKLQDGHYDVVSTYRIWRGDGILRYVQSGVYNLIFSLLFPGTGLSDINAKPKIIRRDFFDKLRLTANDWFLDAEMIIQLRRHKARMAEIPTVFLVANERESFVRASTIWEFVINLIRARFREFFIA